MKISNYIKGFAVSTMLVATCAFQSMAAGEQVGYYSIGGSFSTFQYSIGYGTANNPNEFPVVTVQSHESGAGAWSFLLDGSELSKEMLRKLEVSLLYKKALLLMVDKNTANGYCGNAMPGNGCSTSGRIYSISISTVE